MFNNFLTVAVMQLF